MKSKTIKIIALFVGLGIIAAAGIGLYLSFQRGPVIGKVEFGTEYHLSEIHKTEKFQGAYMNPASYFKINDDKTTGVLYLAGLEATSEPIPFIVTKFEESNKQTVIHLQYIINQGNDTRIQYLQAISTNDRISIKNVESHGIQDVITENPGDISELEYEITIMVFRKEAA